MDIVIPMSDTLFHSDLIDLAKSDSQSDKKILLSKLAEQFIANETAWSEREALLFDEALRALVEQTPRSSKAALAHTVAACSRGLAGLHRRLAEDEPDIAHPVLARSTMLDDGFLLNIAQSKGNEHRAAIGERAEINETLAETLVELGDLGVKRTVAGNSGARLTRRAFSILSEVAAADEGVRDAVSHRTDLPEETMTELMALLAPEGRARLQALLDQGRDHALRVVGEARAKIEADLPQRRQRRLELRLRAKEIENSEEARNAFITELANADQVLDLALILSEMTGLPERTLSNCLLGISAEPMACVSRLLSLDQSTVLAIARLRGRKLNLPDTMSQHMIKLWMLTDIANARRVLNIARLKLNHARLAEHKEIRHV